MSATQLTWNKGSDNSRITDGKLWAALGFSSSKIPDVAGHSEDGRLFKRVKADLRDIVEANMNWHKTYTQQTSRVFDNVIADVRLHIYLVYKHVQLTVSS